MLLVGMIGETTDLLVNRQ